jgi:chemotaxis response regulator CheB
MGRAYPMPVVVVLHRNNIFESSLEELLTARTQLAIKEVEEKEPILPEIVYLCPADYHVLVEQDHTFSLDYSERVNYSRPSLDVTFRRRCLWRGVDGARAFRRQCRWGGGDAVCAG